MTFPLFATQRAKTEMAFLQYTQLVKVLFDDNFDQRMEIYMTMDLRDDNPLQINNIICCDESSVKLNGVKSTDTIVNI